MLLLSPSLPHSLESGPWTVFVRQSRTSSLACGPVTCGVWGQVVRGCLCVGTVLARCVRSVKRNVRLGNVCVFTWGIS